MAGKVFNQDKIAQCVQLLDELAASGLGTQAFAQARGLSYTQLRAWQNHQARWRQRLAGGEPVRPAQQAVRTRGFMQVQPINAATPPVAPVAPEHQGQSIRIECSHGARSATVHWPSSQPMQCAQWLAAYLA